MEYECFFYCFQLPQYLEKEWSCRNEIDEEPQEFAVWTFNSYDSPTKMSLDLGMHTLNKDGSYVMSLYCPFWMLNKTGLMIGYRVNIVLLALEKFTFYNWATLEKLKKIIITPCVGRISQGVVSGEYKNL